MAVLGGETVDDSFPLTRLREIISSSPKGKAATGIVILILPQKGWPIELPNSVEKKTNTNIKSCLDLIFECGVIGLDRGRYRTAT